MTGYRTKSGMTWLRCLVAAVISARDKSYQRERVDFDKLLDFLYDYQCGVWTYGVLINP